MGGVAAGRVLWPWPALCFSSILFSAVLLGTHKKRRRHTSAISQVYNGRDLQGSCVPPLLFASYIFGGIFHDWRTVSFAQTSPHPASDFSTPPRNAGEPR